ncbi:MAG: aldehyde dehydrogenase family protein, partial [Candidatus Dormibacteraeota bacterium]|nr:aldehyde dehydrogenase family protein [Candidatus Dormibacteraeota bacterium]
MALTKRRESAIATRGFEYQPAPEATDHVQIADRYGLFIGGKFVEPKSGKWFPTINPATEDTLAQVAEALEADVNRAVEAAAKAQESWARLNPVRRARYILRISRIIQERTRELAVVETMNGGKPIKESRDVD